LNAEPLISPAEPGSRFTPAGAPIEVADVIIAELIAIGFTLASCVNIADDMAFSRVAQVVADLDRIVQRLDNSRTQPDQAWALNPAWARPDHDVTGNNTRTSPPWRRRRTLARSVRNDEPSAHVFAWAEEFFAHYASSEEARRFASRAQWPFGPGAQEQEKEETR
jgi:hypothetical protein